MGKRFTILFVVVSMITVGTSSVAVGHSGRTDSYGGHNCNVGSCAGTYHFHSGAPKISPETDDYTPKGFYTPPVDRYTPPVTSYTYTPPVKSISPLAARDLERWAEEQEDGWPLDDGRTVAVVIAAIGLVLVLIIKGRNSS